MLRNPLKHRQNDGIWEPIRLGTFFAVCEEGEESRLWMRGSNMTEKDRSNQQERDAGSPHRLTQDEQQDERNPLIEQREEAPREGESPARPPREEPPTPDEAEITPVEEWHQVPNVDGQAGIPWEELRKGMTPPKDQTAEERLWDDRGASEPQQIDYPKKTWDELPDETEPPEEKISSS
jgi:hypothetical protein